MPRREICQRLVWSPSTLVWCVTRGTTKVLRYRVVYWGQRPLRAPQRSLTNDCAWHRNRWPSSECLQSVARMLHWVRQLGPHPKTMVFVLHRSQVLTALGASLPVKTCN